MRDLDRSGRRRARAAPRGRPRSRGGRARGRTRCWRRPGRPGRCSRRSARASSAPKNSDDVGMPALAGDLGDVACGLDAQHRDAARDDVLQQVAVVAGDLEHAAPRPSAEALDRRRRRSARRAPPTSREGGEVRVLARRSRRARRIGQLDEQAAVADPDVERVERLHLVELVGAQEALAQRGHPEVDERPLSGAPHERQRNERVASLTTRLWQVRSRGATSKPSRRRWDHAARCA